MYNNFAQGKAKSQVNGVLRNTLVLLMISYQKSNLIYLTVYLEKKAQILESI